MLGLKDDIIKVPREKMVRRLYYQGKLKVFPKGEQIESYLVVVINLECLDISG